MAVEREGLDAVHAGIDHAEQAVRRDGHVEIGAGDHEARDALVGVASADPPEQLAGRS